MKYVAHAFEKLYLNTKYSQLHYFNMENLTAKVLMFAKSKQQVRTVTQYQKC